MFRLVLLIASLAALACQDTPAGPDINCASRRFQCAGEICTSWDYLNGRRYCVKIARCQAMVCSEGGKCDFPHYER